MNGAEGERFQAPAKKSRQPVDRPDDGKIHQAWLDGQEARRNGLFPRSNPHDDFWLGTAWADGWHGAECPFVARGWW